MDLFEAFRARRSVRAYRDEPVPRDLLERILSEASRAPSAINMQPWEVHVVIGEERKRLSRRLLKAFRERSVSCGPGAAGVLPQRYMDRSRECADLMIPLLARMGLDFRTFINEGSLDFYAAPVVVLMFLDDCFPPERMADVGLFTAFLLLAATAEGLATCPIGMVRAYEDDLKDHLNVPESKRLVVAVALGYPDDTAPINEFRSPRAELKEFVRWID
ncbi:MAG: nitroreductase [Acidobacteriota bacterium]